MALMHSLASIDLSLYNKERSIRFPRVADEHFEDDLDFDSDSCGWIAIAGRRARVPPPRGRPPGRRLKAWREHVLRHDLIHASLAGREIILLYSDECRQFCFLSVKFPYFLHRIRTLHSFLHSIYMLFKI
jgi:hypothetical protein